VTGFIAFADTCQTVVMFRGVTAPPDPFTIVLDFCNGGSLYSTLKGSEDISKTKEVEWALDIATGMVTTQHNAFHQPYIDCRHIFIMVFKTERSYTEI
jgi:hypothetical protein